MIPAERRKLPREEYLRTDARPHVERTGFALTPIQQGMLADSLAVESRGLNVEQVVCEIDEWLDAESLRVAWQHALDSFDALRLRFDLKTAPTPVQYVIDALDVPFRFFDWSAHDPSSVDQALGDFLDHDRWQGFEIAEAPLFRVTVFRFPASKTVMLWTVHHTIIDGASYPIVMERVLTRVGGPQAGAPLLPGKNTPYRAFLEWMGNYDSKGGVDFYREVLRGFSEPTPLPLVSLTSQRQTNALVGNAERKIEGQLTARLQEVAARTDTSLNTIVQLAWGLLLGRYTGREDVVFGATWAGRHNTVAGAQTTVGPFINTLPVRVDVTGGPTCANALQALRAQHVASRPYHQTSPAKIREASELARSDAMFRTLVVFEAHRPLSALSRNAAGIGRPSFWTRSQVGYPLSLAAHVEGGSLAFELEFDTKLFDAAQANAMLDGLTYLLGAMPDSLDECVTCLPVIEPSVYRSMTVDQVARETVPARPRVIDQILARAMREPDATAISDLEGRALTYGQLRNRVLRAAAGLRRLGVSDGDIVAISIPRSIDAVIAQLAVLQAGAAFLMLDLGFPEARLRYCLEDSGSRWLIVTAETRDRISDPAAQRVDIGDLCSSANEKADAGVSRQAGSMAGSELSYLIYTSGSTGQPKGVRIGEASLANHVAASIELYELGTQDRILQFSAQSFHASIEEIFPTLVAGATLVMRNDKMASCPREFFAAIAAHRISVVDLPTAFWHQIVQLSDDQPWPGCVRLLIVGGERASPAVLRRFRESANAHIRWLNSYGPTETTVGSTVYDDRDGDHNADYLPIGMPMPGHSHYLLDDRLRPVPPGVTGHLYIGGAGVALGYHNRESLTAERFIAHPWRTGAKLYATGDLVRKTPRGNHVYVDRVDNQVKVRGFRVELGEIETRLRQHPLVREAVVVAHARDAEVTLLVGYVEAQNDVTAIAIREYLASTLPHYMVPGHIVIDPDLPRTNAGKIDRQALKARDLCEESNEVQPAQDLDPLEGALLKIWSELLGVPVHDPLADFFELGGNSLIVMSLFATIEKRFEKTLNPVGFLRTPTLRHLAGMIRGEDQAAGSALLRMTAGRPGVRPLFLTPGLTGRGSDYVHLVNALDRSIPVYAIQIRGLRNREEPHPNLAEAAQDYVNSMREVQPHGPYALAGFSAGCIVAVIIAKALIERGERVDFVGMIDGIPPPTVLHASPFSNRERAVNFFRTALGRVVEVMKAANPLRILWRRGSLAARRLLQHWFQGSSGKDATIDEIFIGQGIPFTSEEKSIMQAHLSMLMQSQLTPLPIDVVLFRTSLNPMTGPYDADLGWSQLVQGRIDVERMPGKHNDLITDRGAATLGERVTRYLWRRTQ